MSYKVTCYHHREAIVKGDLEAETVVESCEVFRLKRDALLYLTRKEGEAKRRGYTAKLYNKKGIPPGLCVYTGHTWIHENSGEFKQEIYKYETQKI